ncbi:MAG: hypothetical protein LAO77_19445 [Acidobacteriia bacterium]|nr:hypothetical protein [Terriglobia bacterium]
MRRRILFALVTAAIVVAIANVPTTTLRGVNYVVTPQSLPLYAKALDFLDRDVNFRRLSAQVAGGATTDDARLRAAFDWTRANIRDTPAGYPVVDDHIWHIVVRGYGQDDQKSDVFTTILTYAGVPAYWIFIGPRPELPLSFVQIGAAWRLVDVANGVIFRVPSGGLATPEELARDRSLLQQGPPTYGGLPYARLFDRFSPPIPPDVTRAQMQMPGPRLWFQMKSLVGRGGRAWAIRPPSRQTVS